MDMGRRKLQLWKRNDKMNDMIIIILIFYKQIKFPFRFSSWFRDRDHVLINTAYIQKKSSCQYGVL